MAFEEAKSMVLKEFPNKKLAGYWIKEDKFIFAFKEYGRRGCVLPTVSADGEIAYPPLHLAGVRFGEMIEL